MINLKFLLGLIPKTANIELVEAALVKEYSELEAYKVSDELKRFLELQQIIESAEFKKKEQDILALVYKNTDDFKKETEYAGLLKSQRIKNHYAVLKSALYANYLAVNNSELLSEYTSLKSIVESEKFKGKQAALKLQIYKSSNEFNSEKEFQALQKSTAVKNHYKIIESEGFKLYGLLHDSDDLKHFLQLKSKYETPEAKALLKQSKAGKVESTPEIEAIVEYETLKKDHRFIILQKFEVSKQFNLYKETQKAGTIEKFEKLQSLVNSDEFKKAKAYLLLTYAAKWEQTDESKEAAAYSKLSSDQKIKDYNKFIVTKEFKLFDEVAKTKEIEHFEELETLVKSDAFKENKTYMLLSFKEKWSKTDEYTQLQEYTLLKKSDKINWYFKVVNSAKFDEIKAWKLTFSDDFTSPKLDKEKWLTRFYYGDTLLNDSFSLSNDRHFNTDGENISISNNVLSITTKREKASGKAWNPLVGFMPKEFEFTSGVINTGKSFRQKYGRFVAKIKVNENSAITQAFWLVGNQIMPQIDILKYTGGKAFFSTFWGNVTEKEGINRSTSKISGGLLKSSFYIYELIWTPDELIWKINNLIVHREKNGIPSEPMYVLLSSGIFNDVNSQNFPAAMDVDWLKCYEKV